ncbi:MAG: FAD-dependent oxidoreductase [Nitrospirae bacterium]|nr:FAD-dependent oxidoreductase [Nitrospirota bacterium]
MSDNEKSLVVSGAGAAGISAAITAARMGRPVLLVEKSQSEGGTVTKSLIHTLGGIFDSSGEFINNGITKELTERLLGADSFTKTRQIGRTWTLQCSPDIYEKVIKDWLNEMPQIKLMLNNFISAVEVDKGSVKSIAVTGDKTAVNSNVTALIDATGKGEALRLINPDLVINNEPKASAGLIFILRGVDPDALRFPNNVKYLHHIRSEVKKGILPPELAGTWIDQGVYEGECYVKMTVDADIAQTSSGFTDKLRDDLISFLRALPAFSNAALYKTGMPGKRDSGRVAGEYCLSYEDVINARKFSDAACRCAWPVEFWDQGKGVFLEYPKENDYYEIPLRSLKVHSLKNVWTAGKCFSADYRARSSARVAGCCWAMGEAVAKAVCRGLVL